MTKTYSEKLKSPYWASKRLEILERDENKCINCGSSEFLHVHHTYYLSNKDPWSYPNESLITLCEVCHTQRHQHIVYLMRLIGDLRARDFLLIKDLISLGLGLGLEESVNYLDQKYWNSIKRSEN